ncbi:MAG: DNA translocase FtsK [Candidatus Dormibacteraeota bacterium]|nr:DNA translocase FtsK [Candidatus Dormibacteraeota bacterium]
MRASRRRQPILTPTQAREAAGVVLAGLALLSLIAMLVGGGPVLNNLHAGVLGTFGVGWPLPVAAGLALGALWIWPRSPQIRPTDVFSALGGALAILGLLSLTSARAGGSLGHAVEALLAGLVGRPGALVILSLALVLSLIVGFHFSVGSALVGLAEAMQAGYAERQRIESLVRGGKAKPSSPSVAEPVGPEGPSATSPALMPELPPAPLPAPLAATAPAAAPAWTPVPLNEDGTPIWREPEVPERPAREREGEGEERPSRPLIRVVADPQDDMPDIDWKLPPLSLLDSVTAKKERMQEEVKRNVRVIEGTLGTFGVEARVVGVNTGPAVTQYELQPAAGVQVRKIVTLQNDLSLALAAAPLRIEAPIPGKAAVGIEVPNKAASLVTIREVIDSTGFKAGGHAVPIALGNDVTGQAISGDLTRMPHLLIAGATGQGKSVCINALVCSLLLRATPAQLRLLMIDPKRVELNGYNGLPHLATPVIVEAHQAAAALRWAVAEMDRRYKLLSAEGVRNILGYNQRAQERRARQLPYIVVVIDELADLMMVAAGEIEELVCRIAQLARAVGIHLVIATQRPSTDIITGLIKANIPSRIAFAVGSQVDSRVILDTGGAEKLLGRGDMLYQPVDAGKPTRIQGAFISDKEVEALVRFWKVQGDPHYIDEVLEDTGAPDLSAETERRLDPLFSRAGRIVDQLADHRVVGGYQGSKSREVLMNLPDVDELLERIGVEG